MKNNEISNLQVFDRMVKEGNTGIALATTLVDSYSTKQGGVIGFGVEKKFSDDASFQREFGFPGTYMLFCFAVDRKEFESTKQKLNSPLPKRYYVRKGMHNNHKNKLDEMLQNQFSEFIGHIVTEDELQIFKEKHAQVHSEYYQGKGKCRPVEYGDSRKYYSPEQVDTVTIYVSETYRLELMPIKE